MADNSSQPDPGAFDDRLDLTLSRLLAAPRAMVWRAWTQAEHLKHWFAPKPWQTPDAYIDPRPGGRFMTVMRGPDGTEFASEGCVLEAATDERLVFTDALRGGWRPNPTAFFTAIITLADEALENGRTGTRYTATALHKDPSDREQHESMGFLEGWGAVAGQLEVYAAGLDRKDT